MSPPCTARSRGLGTVTGWPTDSPGPHPCCAVPSSNGNARAGSLGRFVLCVFVLWTSATRPPNRVTAHRHHDVTHASISLGSSQRNQPLGRLNDRHDRGSVPWGRLRTKASMWRSPVDAASCPASAPSTTFAHSANVMCGPANLRRCRIGLLLYGPSPMLHRTNCQKLEAQFTDEPLLPVSPTGLADADGGRSLHPASVPGDPPGGSVNPGAWRGLALPPTRSPSGTILMDPSPQWLSCKSFGRPIRCHPAWPRPNIR
jgi:hypothetical protein